jgi:hypothetical protein
MKKLFTIIFVAISIAAFAQAPEKMSYQAVMRNSENTLVTNSNVGMRVSILQGSTTGSAMYVERHTAITNANGLLSIEIGNGTVSQGTFASINWSTGPYFIKTEADPNGGTNYTIEGVSQFLSVPYALHAKTAETCLNCTGGSSADPNATGFTNYVGKVIDGGMVAHVRKVNGVEQGLIISLTDIGSHIFGDVHFNNEDIRDGAINTNNIVNHPDHTNNSAAEVALNYGTGWYLPSSYEMQLIIRNYNEILFGLEEISGDPLVGYYWTSNMYTTGSEPYIYNLITTIGFFGIYPNIANEYAGQDTKFLKVRAVKKF